MSTQEITDYLAKQLFINKNIVTYRSLSRQFTLHVNRAKNELATYHHLAPYNSQQCSATIFLSGTLRPTAHPEEDEDDENNYRMKTDTDYIMEKYATRPTQETYDDDGESDDGEDVPETRVTLVNEKDLEDAKDKYDEIHSMFVYSLSPAPLHDAGYLCEPTDFVRATDRTKDAQFGKTMGRLIGTDIKPNTKKGKQPMRAPPPQHAGPSRLRTGVVAPEAKTSGDAVSASTSAKPKGVEEKSKSEAALDRAKPKQTGKLNFFMKPKETVTTTKEPANNAKQVKKEDGVVDLADKKMFFSKPTASKPATAKAKAVDTTEAAEPVAAGRSEKIGPPRGKKRKSSIGHEPERQRTPENPSLAKAGTSTRVKGRVIVSDDEESAPVQKASSKRKSRMRERSGSVRSFTSHHNSEAEKAGLALMDVDDEQVEKVSRAPTTVPSTNCSDEGTDMEETVEKAEEDHASPKADGEDIDMGDDTAPKQVGKKRKPKVVVPVGRNGLKKRKVMKTRRSKDTNGYLVTEDYTDWESVNEDDADVVPAKPAKKARMSSNKKENVEVQPEQKEKSQPKEDTTVIKAKEPAVAKPKPKAAPKPKGNVRTKQGLLNFFGPSATTKKES